MITYRTGIVTVLAVAVGAAAFLAVSVLDGREEAPPIDWTGWNPNPPPPESCRAGSGLFPPMQGAEDPDYRRDPFLGCNRGAAKRSRSPADPMTHGWILLEDDAEKIFSAIDAAAEYDVGHIELSHSIIKNIDPLLEDEDLVDLVNEVTHRAGDARVYLWTHEFNDTDLDICFPDPGAYATRLDKYRRALAKVPEVAGVVVTLASTDVNPFEARCRCEGCAGPGGPAYTPDPPTRVILLMNALARVVHEEMGREVWLRTFGHHPWQLEWMGVALRDAGLHPAVAVISKEVPQDWQPYYPDNPVIGRVGDRRQLIELDVAGEYWGLSRTPSVMIDYLAWRLPRLLRHASGATVRIERKTHRALGTVNEANLFAVSRLLSAPPDNRQQIWDQWLEERYSLAPGSEPAKALQKILASTFRISMQTHYLLGFWAMSKRTDLPKTATVLKQLDRRSQVWWSEGWEANHAALAEPDENTLTRIWQEKTEAILQARENVVLLARMRSHLKSGDGEELEDQLIRQEFAARAWRLAADVAVRYRRWSTEQSEADRALIERHQRELLKLADRIEERWRDRDPFPSPERIREFVESLPRPFQRPDRLSQEADATAHYDPPLIVDLVVENTGESVCAGWRSTLPGIGALAHAESSPEGLWMPPTFADREPSVPGDAIHHRACVPAPRAGTRIVLRPEVLLGDGRTLVASPREVFF